MSLSPDSELTSKALGKPQGVMFHSDQGMHYTSRKFRQRLWQHQITQSMSRRGNFWGNAPMERFFTYKQNGCLSTAMKVLMKLSSLSLIILLATTPKLDRTALITARAQMRQKKITG